MIAAQETLFSAPMAARGTGVKINRAGRRGAASSTLPKIQQWALDDAITVVLFAGLGGACQGLEEAGMPVNVANNHDEVAIAAHQALHPHTKHIRGDIFDVDPIQATGGRRVKVLWASPDCRDHSVAKGGAPRSARVRSLPWQVCRWAGKTRPSVIFIENVREIRGWGPLVAKRDKATGRVLKLDGAVAAKGERVPREQQQLVRDKARQGRTFRRFVSHLKELGAAYDDRDLNCADYGVPTARRRYFGVARFDGQPIRWPERTHAPREEAAALGLLPWASAASIIDWSQPMTSIFERRKPLAPATLKRVASGLKRFVLETQAPFIVPLCHTKSGSRVRDGRQPLPTITTAKGGEMAVASAFLTIFNENSHGQKPDEPIQTIMAGAPRFGLVAAFMAQHNTGLVGHEIGDALSTLTTAGTQQQVAAAYLAELRGTSTAMDVAAPVPTQTAGGFHTAAVAAFLTKYYGASADGQDCRDALHSLSTRDRFGVVTVTIQGQPYAVTDIRMRMLAPAEAAAAHELELPKSIWIEVKGRDGSAVWIERALTKTEQMRLIGNSVPKRMARLLAVANDVHALNRQMAAE